MSDLKNIFYGDRVVQQAYLNDALIYQADSWTNTPSTKQLDYVSSLPLLRKTRRGASVRFNSKNEMIVVDEQYNTSDSNYYYRISKINTSDGTLLYSTDSVLGGTIPISTFYYSGTSYEYSDEEYMYIDKKDIIHVVFSRKANRSSSIESVVLLNITDTGKDFSVESTVLDASIAIGMPYTVTFDDNYFYLSILSNNHYVIKAINYSCTDIHEMITPTSWAITSLGTYTDSVYLYGYSKSSTKVVQFNKYTWTSKVVDLPFTLYSSSANKMHVDDRNNLYFYTTNMGYYNEGTTILRYSTVNKTSTNFTLNNKYSAEVYHLAFDSKYNMYAYCQDYNNLANLTGRICYKVAPSFKSEWVAIDSAKANESLVGSTNIGNVFIDKYDSIYMLVPVAMSSNSYDYAYKIYKYSNLEQVQSS